MSYARKDKTVHKYSRTLIPLIQPTTNQITPLAFMPEKPESFTASTYARSDKIFGISKIFEIQFHALFIHAAKFEKIQGFAKLPNKKK